MKTIFQLLVRIGLILFFLFCIAVALYPETYKVELTFCDGRQKKIILVESSFPPSNNSIDTYKRAVPEFNGYLNVCEIRVIERINN
jgi:hypothetical protein